MSGKFRFEIPNQRRAAPRPPRRLPQRKQPIPRAERPVAHPQGWDWAPEIELVVGVPRADRKAQKGGDNV
jgi:hypothetical protein